MIFQGNVDSIVQNTLSQALSKNGKLYNMIDQRLTNYQSALDIMNQELVQFETGGFNAFGSYTAYSSRMRTKDFMKKQGSIYVPSPYSIMGVTYYHSDPLESSSSLEDSMKAIEYKGGGLGNSYTFLSSSEIASGAYSSEDIYVKFHVYKPGSNASFDSDEIAAFGYKYTKLQYIMQLISCLAPALEKNTHYTVGQIFNFGGNIYKVIQEFSTTAAGNLPTNTTVAQSITISEALRDYTDAQVGKVKASINNISQLFSNFKDTTNSSITSIFSSLGEYQSILDEYKNDMLLAKGNISNIKNQLQYKTTANSSTIVPLSEKLLKVQFPVSSDSIQYYNKFAYRRGNWIRYQNELYYLDKDIPFISETSMYSWDSNITQSNGIIDTIYEAIRAICVRTSNGRQYGNIPIYHSNYSYESGMVVRGPNTTNNAVYKLLSDTSSGTIFANAAKREITLNALDNAIVQNTTSIQNNTNDITSINSNLDNLKALIAPAYQFGSSYNNNSIFWYENELYKVITSIGSDEYPSDSNTTKITIASLITELLNSNETQNS